MWTEQRLDGTKARFVLGLYLSLEKNGDGFLCFLGDDGGNELRYHAWMSVTSSLHTGIEGGVGDTGSKRDLGHGLVWTPKGLGRSRGSYHHFLTTIFCIITPSHWPRIYAIMQFIATSCAHVTILRIRAELLVQLEPRETGPPEFDSFPRKTLNIHHQVSDLFQAGES